MTVRMFLATVDSAELTEWIALYELRAEEQERAGRDAEREAKKAGGAKRPAGGMGAHTPDDVTRIIEEAQARERARDGS